MATDSKKETFRKYLESAGVIDSLTKVLVALYEEPDRPGQAIDFLKMNLGAPTPEDMARVEEEKKLLEDKVAELEGRVKELEVELEAANAPEGEGEDPDAKE
eukprot:CAMPEP_0182912754 /NCGR_PEP_ID=MMETSP0034_2-20130328/37684_1 /TAXON_ID=156128 /ORGANISM="Nephroselmis pyriformis, Strain CCMP717" /LENGTH=101 /DNA_ID=CAMNT_0025049445 /DNA_START=27 /DNA_END=332 /DNA_ORIENTATION=+